MSEPQRVRGVAQKGMDEWKEEVGAYSLVASGESRARDWKVYKTEKFGLALELNGDLQSTEADQELYHKALILPALTMSTKPIKRSLVLGSGPGGTLPILLSHTSALIHSVDIDLSFVQEVRIHLASWHQGAACSPRVTEVWTDATQVLKETESQSFDLIVVDFPDPRFERSAEVVMSPCWWREVHRVLIPTGVLAVQAGDPLAERYGPEELRRVLHPYFEGQLQVSDIPSFGDWAFFHAVARAQPLLSA